MMNYSKTVSIFTITTVHILSLLLLLTFCFSIHIKAKKDNLLYSFLSTQLAFGIWMVAKILKTVSPVFGLRWFFVVVQYFSICMLEVVFLNFAYNYYKGENLPKWFLKIITTVASIQFVFIATNEYHHLFYSEFDFWGDEFGALFYVHMLIMYGCIIGGIVLIARKFNKAFYHSKEFYWLSGAIVFPLLANIFYLSGYYHRLMRVLNLRSFDITPLAFSLSLGIFAYAIYNTDFLNLMPILEEEAIRHAGTGVIILDGGHRCIEMNNAAAKFIDWGCLETAYFAGREVVDKVVEQKLETHTKPRHIHIVKQHLLDDKNTCIGFLITLSDITSFIELQENINEQVEELQAANFQLKEQIQLKESLSKVSARNFVSRELHDILGHSMTIAIKLLEIGLMEYEKSKDEEQLRKQVEEAYNICNKGYNDLRVSLQEKQEISYDLVSLKSEINKIGHIVKVAGVDFELNMNMYNGLLREDEYFTIKRFVQEGVTNSVKHGKAGKITVDMVFDNKGNRITISDDGLGCSDFKQGNGLRGMEERARKIIGKVSYELNDKGGFKIVLDY